MITKIKNYIMAFSLVLTMATPVLATSAVYADAAADKAAAAAADQAKAIKDSGCNNITSNIAGGASDASGGSVTCGESTLSQGKIGNTAGKIVNLFSVIVGIAAIIMIIYGGFRYITSGGDSGRVGNAKNTLIYAVIGLVIVALAQVIVHFVLNQSSQLAA